MKCFLAMQKTDFSRVWAFLQKKVILELNCTNHFFKASENTNSVFSATKQMMRMRGPQMLKSFFLRREKLLNAILRVKLKLHEKCFFLMKWNVFCHGRRQIFIVWVFAEKVILELNAQNHFFRASENTNSVFSATKQMMRMRGHRCSKASFSEKKLNAILRVKLNYMKNVSFSWNEMFFAMQKTDFHVFELFCRKSHFRA